MSKELDTKGKRTSASKSSGKKTSGKKSSSRRSKKRKKAKMITFAIEAVILVVLLVVLYVLNRTELLSKVTYDDEIVQESVNDLAEETAKLLGAVPVITTATDLHKRFAVDIFAKKKII